MDNALTDWLITTAHALDKLGVNASIAKGYLPGSYSVNLDSHQFVGTLCFWPNNTFEIQFNDCNTGKVICLETVCFTTPLQLNAYLDALIFENLTTG